MKLTRIFSMISTAALTLGLAGMAYAYHDGGVAYCDGCHTMHNSSGNAVMAGVNRNGATNTYAGSKVQFQGNSYLLKGSDQSSTCLNCHASPDTTPNGYHIMTYPAPAVGGNGPVERTPGGDFAWLTMTFPKAGYADQSVGERHGHNIIAADYGLVADSVMTAAPGGTYLASKLSCVSCHDPHSRSRIEDTTTGVITKSAFGSKVKPIAGSGSYGGASTATEAVGVYRILGTAGYAPMSYSGAPTFASNPPIAVAPSTYNRSEATTETHVAYGQGMSEWCSNCHVAIHNNNTNSANTALIHPAGNGALLTAAANDLNGGTTQTIAGIYNAYKMSGDLSGTQTSSYTSLVPYEEGTGVIATLAARASNSGAAASLTGPITGTENVMCLSCHRAHASGFNHMTRWNNDNEYITVAGAWPSVTAAAGSDALKNSSGMTTAEYQAAMYDRPATLYATYQRSMCNKCHAKD